MDNPAFASADASAKEQNPDQLPEMGGRFFGQSSFANFSVVSEKSVVNANNLIKSKEELQLFAPLGCGIQTGEIDPRAQTVSVWPKNPHSDFDSR